jgi:hypothetical protein
VALHCAEMAEPRVPAVHEESPRPASAELVRGPEAVETMEAVVLTSAHAPARAGERAGLAPAQAAAVAAGSFLAGAAVVGVVGRRRRARTPAARPRRLLRRRGAGGGRQSAAAEALQIVASRSLLVDVHLLGLPGPER